MPLAIDDNSYPVDDAPSPDPHSVNAGEARVIRAHSWMSERKAISHFLCVSHIQLHYCRIALSSFTLSSLAGNSFASALVG